MSIRVALCFLFVLGFSVYAWRNWFASLCASILLMAVLEHPDMPKNIGGVQGLNPWNLLMANVIMAWLRDRANQVHHWEMPRLVVGLFLAYAAIVVVGSVRFYMEPAQFDDVSMAFLISEYFVNSFKFILPGLLLFESCRDRRKAEIALAVILCVYFLLAIQVIRWVPLRFAVASGNDLARVAGRLIPNEVGYNRVTLSMMLGGASWGVLAAMILVKKPLYKLALAGVSFSILLGQSLTAGRTGYVSWAAVGLCLCLLRWRKALLVLPVIVIAILSFLPGVRDRFFAGWGGKQGVVVVRTDDYAMTSGRTMIWPYVIEKIEEDPLFGYGREAMTRTGLRDWLWNQLAESFPHPHNAYLESLLDNGILGFIPTLALFLVLLFKAISLFMDRGDPLCSAAGGVAAALVLSLLVGAMGGQTFYAREGAVGMWAAFGVMLRVSVERAKARQGMGSFFGAKKEASRTVEFTPNEEPLVLH